MNSLRTTSPGTSRYFRAAASAMLALCTLGIASASWATLRAQLERNTVQEGETVTLRIESDGRQSGERPDLAPLSKDFDVLGTSTSTEISFTNGSRADLTRWLVRLQPRHAGTINIPPITVGGEQTATLDLKVTDASSSSANQDGKHAILEVEASAAGKSLYVAQQIPYTVRLYYDDTIQTGQLAAPDPADAIVESLGEEKRYTAMRDGREYKVIERRYAIAAEKSGALHIPPARFRGTAVVEKNGDGDSDPADDLLNRFLRNSPFANDPAFRGSLRARRAFGDEPQPVAASSREITFDVLPRPAAAHGTAGSWLPAEQIALHDSWDDNPPRFKVGEPVTRTITVDAKGLAASQIPPLSLSPPTNARLYPEASDNQSRTDGDAIYGISKQSVTYIPTAQGTLVIPPVELAWWSTRSNAQSHSALLGREFKVEPGAATVQPNSKPLVAVGPVVQASAPAPPVAADAARKSVSLTDRLRSRWKWVATGFALLAIMLATAGAIRRYRHRGFKAGQPTPTSTPVPQHKATMRALHLACVAHDRYAAARALLDLARVEWPSDPPGGLSALASRLDAGVEEISALDRSLYGADGANWKGDALWNALGRGLQRKRREARGKDDSLEPLYL